MKTLRELTIYMLLSAIWVVNGCEHSSEDSFPTIPPVTQTAEIGSSGGCISLKDSAGLSIEIVIPSGALDSPTPITITSVGEVIKNPISNTIYRGLRIEPEDLLLKEPATIRITFPPSVKNIDKICLFTIMDDDYVIPLAERSSGSHNIEGKIYFFKNYAAGIPTEQEVNGQIAKSRERTLSGNARTPGLKSLNGGSCPPLGYGWQGTETVIHGMLEWAAQLSALGNDEGAAKAINATEQLASSEIEDFLKLDMPEDPCGNYTKAAWQYFQLSKLLEVNQEIADAIEKRAYEAADKCAIRFTIEIDREIKKEGNEKEHIIAYGVVKCSIPWEDFSDAEATTSGQGVLSYSLHYEWLYNQAMNYKSTADASGTVEVTCEGHTEVIVSPQGEAEIWLHVGLHFKDNITGRSCDSGSEENPCIDTESHAEWNESADFLFQNGYTNGEQVNTKNGFVRYKMTLYIISMNQGDHDSDSGICY